MKKERKKENGLRGAVKRSMTHGTRDFFSTGETTHRGTRDHQLPARPYQVLKCSLLRGPLGLKGWALGRLRLKRLKTCLGKF